jgi:hypothetical protein
VEVGRGGREGRERTKCIPEGQKEILAVFIGSEEAG